MKSQLTLAALLGLVAVLEARADLTNGLVAYYNFDQSISQTIADQSGQGRDGTLYYAWAQGPGGADSRGSWGGTAPGDINPYIDGAGKWGNGLALQGTTIKPKLTLVAKLGADYDGAAAQNVTISYWAKRESYRSAGWGSKGVMLVRTPGDRTVTDPTTVDWGDWSDAVPNIDYDTLQPRYGGGNFEVRMFGNASQRNFNVGGVLSGNGIGGALGSGDNKWHHFLWEYAPDNSVSLTVDGTLVAKVAGSGWGTLPFDSIVIGESWDTGGDINDSLDDVALWNRVLTSQEKTNLLTQPVIPAPEPPTFGTRDYAWNGSSNSLPAIYLGGENNYPNAGGVYAMANGRLKVSSPGGQGWLNNAFDWVGPLANNEKVTGSVTLRINSYSNGPDADSQGRVRLFWFNAPYANGLNAFAGLYGSDKWLARDDGSPWKPDLLRLAAWSDWGKWEFNPSTAGAYAPQDFVYLFNSLNMNDPAASTDYFRPVRKGTDHVFSWTARYQPTLDAVQVDTALDGVYWTTTYVDRKFNNLGWAENALAKQHGSMQGPWEAEFTQIKWATTTTTTPTDTKNYWWNGRQNIPIANSYPPLYVGGTNNYAQPDQWYVLFNDNPVLSVGGSPATGWKDNSFNWTGSLTDQEKVSGSTTFYIENFTNSISGANPFGRVRLLWVNATYTNGLNAFASLYASDKQTTRSAGWGPGGDPDWNKWEYNPDTAGAHAPDGQVYIYNSFNMNNPASDTNFFKAINQNAPHTFSWSAQYIPANDVVRVQTALDGEAWTTTDVNRSYSNLGWGENVLAKQHGSMQDGAWSAAYGVLTWTTSPADPTLSITKLTNGNVQLTWPFGTLLEASNATGPWTAVVATSPHTATSSGQKYYRVLVH